MGEEFFETLKSSTSETGEFQHWSVVKKGKRVEGVSFHSLAARGTCLMSGLFCPPHGGVGRHPLPIPLPLPLRLSPAVKGGF